MNEEELLNWLYEKPAPSLVTDKLNKSGINSQGFFVKHIETLKKRITIWKAVCVVSLLAVVIFSLIMLFAGLGSFTPIIFLAVLSVACYIMLKKEEGRVTTLKIYEGQTL